MFASGKIACFMQNFFCKSDDHLESTSPRSPEEVAKASTLQRNPQNQSYRRNRRISSKRRKTTATPKGLDVPEIRFIQTNSKNYVVTIPSDKETKETSNSDDKTIQTDTSFLYKEMNKRVVTPPEGQSALHLTATTVCIVCTIGTPRGHTMYFIHIQSNHILFIPVQGTERRCTQTARISHVLRSFR